MTTKEAMAVAFAQECLRAYLNEMNYGVSISGGDTTTADVFLNLYRFAINYFTDKGY